MAQEGLLLWINLSKILSCLLIGKTTASEKIAVFTKAAK